MRAIVFAALFVSITLPALTQQVSLDAMISKEEQARIGTSGMSPERLAALTNALTRAYQQGFAAGRSRGSQPSFNAATPIETQVDGEFNGWEGETIVKLMNGQIWQQTEYRYEYHYAYMPNVLVYPSRGGFKMKVDGTSQAVGVERLR